MKYVRVYESYYEAEYLTTYQEHCEHVANIQDNGFDFEGHIVKQADTIEELIDCYTVILEHQDRPLVVYKNEIEHYKHCLVDKVKSNNRVLAIYGSIWAGVDLLSKSKMNEKGYLELL